MESQTQGGGKSKVGLIIGLVVGLGVIAYAVMMGKRKQDAPVPTMPEQSDATPTKPSFVSKTEQYNVLNNIENPELREYIASILTKEQAEKLAGWLNLIDRERKLDSNRWKYNDKYPNLDASDVSAGLWQMKQQGVYDYTGDVQDKIIELG